MFHAQPHSMCHMSNSFLTHSAQIISSFIHFGAFFSGESLHVAKNSGKIARMCLACNRLSRKKRKPEVKNELWNVLKSAKITVLKKQIMTAKQAQEMNSFLSWLKVGPFQAGSVMHFNLCFGITWIFVALARTDASKWLFLKRSHCRWTLASVAKINKNHKNSKYYECGGQKMDCDNAVEICERTKMPNFL